MSGDRPSPARIDQDGVRVEPDAERALAAVEAEHPRGGGGEPGQQARAAPAPGHGLIEHDLHEALETAEAAPRAHDAVYRLVLFVGTRRRMIRADTGQGAVQHVFPEPVSGLGGPQGRRTLEDRTA